MISVRDHMILDLAGRYYAYQGAREQDIRHRVGLSSVRFYQRLDWLLDQPEVVAAAPMRVRQLVGLRDARRSARRPSALDHG